MLADFDSGEERERIISNRSGLRRLRGRWRLGIRRTACTRRGSISESGGWAEDVSDVEIVSAIQELAETEGVFTETAGGVTTAVTARLYPQGRIHPDETDGDVHYRQWIEDDRRAAGAYEQACGHSSAAGRFRGIYRREEREQELGSGGGLCRLEFCCPMHFRSTPTARGRLHPAREVAGVDHRDRGDVSGAEDASA